tara:strand:+ start:295 stop:492 length:198 start_codon:yes stop_codon:yes gene_type:complete
MMIWTDVNEIAIELYDKYPDMDPTYILFTDLQKLVMELEGFEDQKDRVNERILETIQMLWIEERD